MLLMLLKLCVHFPLSRLCGCQNFLSHQPFEIIRASAFLTPTFRAEPADSCDGTCTCGTWHGRHRVQGIEKVFGSAPREFPASSRIRILRGFSTANAAPRWSTTNHDPIACPCHCLCHLSSFTYWFTKKKGVNHHEPSFS